jgi:uncharacterized membrane protein
MKVMTKNFKEWAKAAAIRAIKTFAQTFLSMIPMGAAFLGSVNWGMAISAAVLSAILSIATSVAGLPEVKSTDDKE